MNSSSDLVFPPRTKFCSVVWGYLGKVPVAEERKNSIVSKLEGLHGWSGTRFVQGKNDEHWGIFIFYPYRHNGKDKSLKSFLGKEMKGLKYKGKLELAEVRELRANFKASSLEPTNSCIIQ